jgi:mRNA interferase YafQ
MRIPEYSTQFRRDVKRAAKRGKDPGEDTDKLKDLLSLLIADGPLPPGYKDHPLKQNWLGYRDAHIEPDWVLIYALVEGADGPIVRFERTGTHTDLFD